MCGLQGVLKSRKTSLHASLMSLEEAAAPPICLLAVGKGLCCRAQSLLPFFSSKCTFLVFVWLNPHIETGWSTLLLDLFMPSAFIRVCAANEPDHQVNLHDVYKQGEQMLLVRNGVGQTYTQGTCAGSAIKSTFFLIL